ncbi:MAG: mechanosensitive ion channel [Eubacteriales bacterium]|nr:mechanosensitive ion channel [Eubacteriales bacterium]MDD4421443.1 mechanosensitive ion channel [Eubacteriales bacterium]
MYNRIFDILNKLGTGQYASLLTYIAVFLLILIICFITIWLTRVALIKIMIRVFKRINPGWNTILQKNAFYRRLSWIVVPIIFNLFNGSLPDYNFVLKKSADIISALLFVFIISSFLNAFEEIYRSYEISKTRPIKGIIQVVKVILSIIGGIFLISVFIGQNPIVLIGGIGALTAVISLIFKDAILGFVAGIQLTSNDMIRIGDWIEMPRYSADGTVTDLSLTTVKVRNFDNTITTVPAYALVSDSFINWRGMAESGGRRIKRSIMVDAATVRLCDDEMISKFKRIGLISGYMESKLNEIAEYNKKLDFDTSLHINSRHLTNLGTFRAYITEYLKHHPDIRSDMTLMVRQLGYEGEGIPIELYAFTNTTKWSEFEMIQSNIFDHLYSVISEFGLSVYQKPSGSDLRKSVK